MSTNGGAPLMTQFLLAIEGGGTKTRLLLADAAGDILARETGGPASGLYISRGVYAREMGKLLRRIERIAKAKGGRVTAVGLGGPMDPALVEQTVQRVLGKVRVIHAGESEIAFALHGVDWGVSLVAGTGASCRAHTPEGLAIGCGGFGPQFGDEGSGYWIGRAALSAAMRAGDKRGPETALTARLCAFYGISRVLDILRFVDKSGHVSGTKVASCVPEVFAAASAGDTVANAICREAGLALGRLVVATARNVKWSRTPIPLVLTGGVFNGGALILKPLRRALRGSRMAFHMYPVVPEPAEGIINIMRRATSHTDPCARNAESRRRRHVSG